MNLISALHAFQPLSTLFQIIRPSARWLVFSHRGQHRLERPPRDCPLAAPALTNPNNTLEDRALIAVDPLEKRKCGAWKSAVEMPMMWVRNVEESSR